MISLGLDIGGANTKAVLSENCEVKEHWTEYIPLWRKKGKLKEFLSELMKSDPMKAIGVTMTGELSDVFESKREGVKEIIEIISEIFAGECYFMSLEGRLLEKCKALESPLSVSAANWVASGLAVGRKYHDCLLVDVGSTTTDLIPIQDGIPSSLGSTDFRRLSGGELIYTGVLRTPLSYLNSKVCMEGKKVHIAAEYFANVADMYRVLGMIEENDYICDTPDGRGKGRKECMRRIARMFCSDLEEVGEGFIKRAAIQFYKKQIDFLEGALENVLNRDAMKDVNKLILTGIGRKILAEKAAKGIDFKRVIDFADIYGEQAAVMTPAFAMSLLVDEVSKDEK